jgi:site-specific DNA-cytosine methylase
MLTYRANHGNPQQLKLYCGSVNDYLAQSIRGEGGKMVAKLGEPSFISAGSPCQGYSLINSLKGNEVSMRNSSMIASVASYIDFFRPMYAVLENVPAMANKSHKRNPLSQLLCAFAGMGYQIRILNLDAWSFGAPQSRSRLFILIAAPGLQLPAHPPLTHSHPEKTNKRSLGEAPNGLPFGNRRLWDPPVFDFVTAIQATKDLPKISTARVMSIPRPDHRPSRTESSITQTLINSIPKAPRTAGFLAARERGWLNEHLITAIPPKKNKSARAWSRVDPHLLIPTITTSVSPACMFSGRWLHWEEDRLLTVMEARRAQGYPDDEVLLGRPPQQWKIVGNSVARQVALALGLVIREACIRNGEAQDTSLPTEARAGVDETDSTTTRDPAKSQEMTALEDKLAEGMSSSKSLDKFWSRNPFSEAPNGKFLCLPSVCLANSSSENHVAVLKYEKLPSNPTLVPEIVIKHTMSTIKTTSTSSQLRSETSSTTSGSSRQILPARQARNSIIPKKRACESNPPVATVSPICCRKKMKSFRNGESGEDPIIIDSD